MTNEAGSAVSLSDVSNVEVSFSDGASTSTVFPLLTEDGFTLTTEDDVELWTEQDIWLDINSGAINFSDNVG